MINCKFELNGKATSVFWCGVKQFTAYSGLGNHVNKRISACLQGQGPIPPGVYYIFDRQSGGLLGPLRDLFNGRDEWFALYAADGRIDDETFCKKVKRGQFRLHPKGTTGRSEGCIVINKKTDYLFLRTILKNTEQISVPGIDFKAYGKLVVT